MLDNWPPLTETEEETTCIPAIDWPELRPDCRRLNCAVEDAEFCEVVTVAIPEIEVDCEEPTNFNDREIRRLEEPILLIVITLGFVSPRKPAIAVKNYSYLS